MKLSERSIRNYIRKLIMETFYVGPQGNVMDKDQMKKQDPTFFDKDRYAKTGYGDYLFQTDAPPPDVPRGEVQSFTYDNRMAMLAKQDLADANPAHVSKLETVMGYPGILGKLTFTEEDTLILPDMDDQNLESITQALNLMYAIGDGLYDYLNHVYDLKGTGFGDHMRRQKRSLRPDNLIQRGVGQVTVLTDAHPLKLLFRPVQEGRVGMGRSLIVGKVDRIIIGALANLNNMTPIEFRDAVYPAVESVVRRAFARMPHVQKNLRSNPELNNALEAYLEAIHYVLAEVIGEINFEYTYDSEGNEQMIFIPSDPTVYKNLMRIAKDEDQYGNLQADASKIASAFRDDKVYDPLKRQFVTKINSVYRDLPDYYSTKFSVNPKEVSVLKEQSGYTFDWRLKVNLGFGIGLSEFEVSDDLGYDAMEVYDDG